MTTDKRLPANTRKQQILDAALRESETRGYTNITRQSVADAAGVAPGLVSHYFGEMDLLRHCVLREAARTGSLRVVAQGLTNKAVALRNIPRGLKERALASCGPR